MGKRKKDRQYNGKKKKGQTIQWAKEKRTDNTMDKRKKDRQCNEEKKKGLNDKMTNNDLQNTKDRATRTKL
jgi:hypothetical protein